MAGESTFDGASSERRELLNVDLPATADAVADVSDKVAAILLDLGIPEEKQLEISLALQEALANAVVHGCGNDSSKKVRCRLDGDKQGRILIIVSDPGPGMEVNPTLVPKLSPNLYQDHGRGIYLIRRLMDDVKFERGGSEIHMWKY
jgi:anti-sigma regulatory factor (Ser/Thr protein kinase)